MKTSTTILALFALLLISCSAQTYTNLTPTQISSNPQVQALIQAGLARVISLGQPKNHFKNTDFSVTKINSVSQAAVTNGNSYKIDVNFTNTANEAVRAKFTGLFNTKTSKTSISSISYTIQYPRTTTNPTNPTNPTTPGTPGTPNTTNTTTSVDVSQLETNALINGLFEFGFNRTVGIGINSGNISNETFVVSKVNSILKQDLSNGAVYTFDCLANNADNSSNVTLSFAVRGQLDAYSYKVQSST